MSRERVEGAAAAYLAAAEAIEHRVGYVQCGLTQMSWSDAMLSLARSLRCSADSELRHQKLVEKLEACERDDAGNPEFRSLARQLLDNLRSMR